jgi:hypothetical protein
MDLDEKPEVQGKVDDASTSKIHFGSLETIEEKKLVQGVHTTRPEPTQHSKLFSYIHFVFLY